MAAIKKFIIHQMETKKAFLNGDLTEKIYMEKPEGLDAPIDKVCKLTKSLCGLKQAPKHWHEKFYRIVRSNCIKLANLTIFYTSRLLKER